MNTITDFIDSIHKLKGKPSNIKKLIILGKPKQTTEEEIKQKLRENSNTTIDIHKTIDDPRAKTKQMVIETHAIQARKLLTTGNVSILYIC